MHNNITAAYSGSFFTTLFSNYCVFFFFFICIHLYFSPSCRERELARKETFEKRCAVNPIYTH